MGTNLIKCGQNLLSNYHVIYIIYQKYMPENIILAQAVLKVFYLKVLIQ